LRRSDESCCADRAQKRNHHEQHHGNHRHHDERHSWRTGRPGCADEGRRDQEGHHQEGSAQAATATKAKTRKTAKSKAAAAPAKKATKATKKTAAAVPRELSKKAIVLDLLKRKGGATMAEIQKATDWQAHSVRGFISGTLTKKMGLAVESTKNDAEERCYKIAK